MSLPSAPDRLGSAFHARLAKLTGSRLFWATFVGVLFALPLGRSLARSLPPAPPVLGQVQSFVLHDQYGRSYGDEQLRGHVWVLTSLPPETASTYAQAVETVRNVIHRAKNLGATFHMVTLGPDAGLGADAQTEAERRSVVEKYCSSAQLWSYLGGSAEEVPRARHAMLDSLGVFADSSPPHDLTLVDGRGRIRGVYGTDKASIDRLMQDTGYIANLP
jgi:hypothetical protein